MASELPVAGVTVIDHRLREKSEGGVAGYILKDR